MEVPGSLDAHRYFGTKALANLRLGRNDGWHEFTINGHSVSHRRGKSQVHMLAKTRQYRMCFNVKSLWSIRWYWETLSWRWYWHVNCQLGCEFDGTFVAVAC